MPTASDLPKIFANFKQQQSEKQKNLISSFVNNNFDSKTIETKLNNSTNDADGNDDLLAIDEQLSIGSPSSPPATSVLSNNDDTCKMSKDFNTTSMECVENVKKFKKV